MRNKRININVYSKPENKIIKNLFEIEPKLKDYNFSYFDISDPPPPQKVIGSLIIVEETSIHDIYTAFKRIQDSYQFEPLFIITSESPNFQNAVRWMKTGASNYIDANKKYNHEEIDKILNEALYYYGQDFFDEEEDLEPFSHPSIEVANNCNWDILENNKYYQITVLMVSIEKLDINKYSQETIDDILKKMEDLITNIIQNFNGKKLFWNYNNGMFIFHFGDKANCAVLASIYMLNKIKLYCLENLELQDILNLKITMHDGKILYSKNETEFITSDTINSAVHLQKINDFSNTIDITENVYKFLNPRVKRFFYKDILFEGRNIYTYYYAFYKV